MIINIEERHNTLALEDLDWVINSANMRLRRAEDYAYRCLADICYILFSGRPIDTYRLSYLTERLESARPTHALNISVDRCIADILFANLLKFTHTQLLYQILSNVSNFYYLLRRIEIRRMTQYQNEWTVRAFRLHQMSALQIAYVIFRDPIHSSTELMVLRMRRMHEAHLPTAPIGKIIKDCCTVMSSAGRYYTNPQYGIHEEVFAAAIQAMLVENIRIKEISGTERHFLARTIYDNRLVPRLVPMLYEVIKNAMSLHSERSNNDLGVLDYSARIEASFLG